MDLNLRNKVIVVSGDAKGIGKAIASQLGEEGAVPVVLDKDKAAGESLGIAGAHFFEADLYDHGRCRLVVDSILKKTGSIDGLVNNAGFNDSVGLENGNPQKFITSLNNNAGHYYYLAHYCLPALKKSKGAIVNISSKVAVTGQGNTSGYAAAKGAILALTREWAVELLPYSIRVNAILPAEVWTPLYQSWVSQFPNPEEKKKSIESKIPFQQRMTTPAEIANAAVFLLSDRSSHITGQWLPVDGGYINLDRAIS